MRTLINSTKIVRFLVSDEYSRRHVARSGTIASPTNIKTRIDWAIIAGNFVAGVAGESVG